MICIYMQVLVPSQRHASSVVLIHLIFKDRGVESYDGLDAHLVVYVHYELLTTRGSHHSRPRFISIPEPKEITHTKQ
jgi:hypothetical protein